MTYFFFSFVKNVQKSSLKPIGPQFLKNILLSFDHLKKTFEGSAYSRDKSIVSPIIVKQCSHVSSVRPALPPVDCERGSRAQTESELDREREQHFDGRCVLTFGGSKD